jgi:hypothetical protein
MSRALSGHRSDARQRLSMTTGPLYTTHWSRARRYGERIGVIPTATESLGGD